MGDQVEGVLDASDLIEQGIYGDYFELNGVSARDIIKVTMKAGADHPDFLPTIVVLNAGSFDEVADSFV